MYALTTTATLAASFRATWEARKMIGGPTSTLREARAIEFAARDMMARNPGSDTHYDVAQAMLKTADSKRTDASRLTWANALLGTNN